MHELEGQVSHQLTANGTAVELDPEAVGHHDTAGVVHVLADSHQGRGGQVGVGVLRREEEELRNLTQFR